MIEVNIVSVGCMGNIVREILIDNYNI